MKIQISLKLRLTKQKKTIKVSYHTFETATFDRYLAASLALRAKSAEDAEQYINDITGQGSLNEHFASLYREMKELSKTDLQAILTNSRVPILKIDASNWYDYYPELDVSIFKRHAYQGDLGEYPNVLEIIQIQEDIVEKKVEFKTFEKPEPYLVELTDDGITATFFDDKVTIPPDVFAERLVTEIKDLQGYKGTVQNAAEGNGWFVLTATKLANLAMTSTSFYDDAGNHCTIRNADVRKTEIALINGLYIYKETNVPYEKNPDLCSKVLDVITKNSIVKNSSVLMIVLLLRNVDAKKAQKFINDNFGKTYFPKAIADFVVRLIQSEAKTNKWHKAILQEVLLKCDAFFYPRLYRLDSSLSFSIEQLITLDSALLTEEDNKKVEEYWNDVKEMQESIRQIVGVVTTKGLRQRSKLLKADNDTRRFTELCNKLIGHVEIDLSKTSKTETENWLKKALELKELAFKIEDKLKKLEAE